MKSFFTLLLTLTTLAAVAQKVDLDRYSFVTTYRDLPQKPLEPAYRTYLVQVQGTRSIRATFSEEELANAVRIDGWQRMERGRAHVLVRPMLEDVIIDKSEVKERVDIQKDKDGKETGRKYYYKLQLEYSFAADVDVADYKGRSIFRQALANRYAKKTWTSQEFNSGAAASNYLQNNREEIKNRFARDEVMAVLGSLSNRLTTDYGFPVRQQNDNFWVLDSKKHPEYDNYQRAFRDVKGILAGISPDAPLTDTFDRLKAPIEYFESLPRHYSSNDKSDAKIRYSVFYNLAKLSLYLDEPDKARKYAEALIQNGYDDADGRSLINKANELDDLFRRNGARTRHFAIDLSNVRPPES